MANFDVETMGFTRMKQLNDGPGRGLKQWETPGRWDHALKWYASKGKNPNNLINDIEAQIEWTLYEFGEILQTKRVVQCFQMDLDIIYRIGSHLQMIHKNWQ